MQDPERYPHILVPLLYTKDYVRYIPAHPTEPQRPKEIEIEDGNLFIFLGCFPFVWLIFGVFCRFFGITFNSSIAPLLQIIGFIAMSSFVIFLFWSRSVSKKQKRDKGNYDSKLSQFHIYYSSYEKAKKTYDNYRRVLNSKTDKEYIAVRLCQQIKGWKPTKNPKKGFSEDLLFDKLKLHLGNYIYHDIEVDMGWITYYPDILYVNPDSNIHIDIEIDEPYDLSSGTPIHCQSDDQVRNETFVENHYIVIRVSEIQVVEQLDNICKLILAFITHIEKSPINLDLFSHDVCPEPFWSEEKAIELRNSNFREKYLKIPAINWEQRIVNLKAIQIKSINHFDNDLDDLPF